MHYLCKNCFSEDFINGDLCYVDSNSTVVSLMKTSFGTLLLSTSYVLNSKNTNVKSINIVSRIYLFKK